MNLMNFDKNEMTIQVEMKIENFLCEQKYGMNNSYSFHSIKYKLKDKRME